MECNQRFDHCSHGQFHRFVFARRAPAKMPSLHLGSNWRCSTGFTGGHPFAGVSSNNKNLWLLCGFGNTYIYIYIFRYKYYLHLCLFAFVLKSFPFRFQIYHHSFAIRQAGPTGFLVPLSLRFGGWRGGLGRSRSGCPTWLRCIRP